MNVRKIIICLIDILVVGCIVSQGEFCYVDSADLFTTCSGTTYVDFFSPNDRNCRKVIVFNPSLIKMSSNILNEYPGISYAKVILKISRKSRTKFCVADIELYIEDFLERYNCPDFFILKDFDKSQENRLQSMWKNILLSYGNPDILQINSDNIGTLRVPYISTELKEEIKEYRRKRNSEISAKILDQIENTIITSVSTSKEKLISDDEYTVTLSLNNYYE